MGFTNLPVGASAQMLTATSGSNLITSFGVNNFCLLSNNRITITPGTWRISAQFMMYIGSAASAGFYALSGLYGANGANSTTQPVSIASLPGVTSVQGFTNYDNTIGPTADVVMNHNTVSGFGSNDTLTPLTCVVTVTQSITIYVVPKLYTGGGSTGGFFYASMQAERISNQF